MAGLFLLFSIALIAIIALKRRPAIALLCAGLILTLLMFFYHATSTVNINL